MAVASFYVSPSPSLARPAGNPPRPRRVLGESRGGSRV